jgi:energy-converting hydrogenase Eha subunit E
MLGLWFALTSEYLFKEPIMKLAKSLISAKEIDASRLNKVFIISLALMFAAWFMQIVNYEVSLNFENPSSWSTMLIEKCGANSIEGAYQARGLTDFGACVGIWGAFWGILLQQKYTPGIIAGTVKNDTCCRSLLRCLVALGVALPFIVYAGIMLLATDISSAYVAMILETMIPTLGIGMSLFFAADWTNVRFGLLEID